MHVKLFNVCIFLAAICLISSSGRSETWTCSPTSEALSTGYSDFLASHDGDALVYGGLDTGGQRKANGFFRFDVAAVPDGTTISAVAFHYHVTDANWPLWSVTPLSIDPTGGETALVWVDIEAEKESGYYVRKDEASSYGAGWKTLFLEGSAATDVTTALDRDWFAIGAASRDGSPDYFQEISGHTSTDLPYLVVYDSFTPANDECSGAQPVMPVPGSARIAGTTQFATDAYNCSASCVGGFDHSGPDLAYSIDLTAGCEICVTLNQSEIDWDAGIYLVLDCVDVNGTCVAGSDDYFPRTDGARISRVEDERFCYLAETTATYYLIVDGYMGAAGGFEMDVETTCLGAPTGLTCSVDAGIVSLSWSNSGNYDDIVVFQNNVQVAQIGGNESSYSFNPHEVGYLCFQVCGRFGGEEACSDQCCLIYGYPNIDVLADFNSDDGGYSANPVGNGWEWGVSTGGACADSSDQGVWATNLDGNYPENACWLLDSPGFTLGSDGGYLQFDHCFDIEDSWDGGNVWFSSDGVRFHLIEPIRGYDGINNGHVPDCPWINNQGSFTGQSDGWITDIWHLPAEEWSNQLVRMRLAFASDDQFNYPGWSIDNVTVYHNLSVETVSAELRCRPTSGTLPCYNHVCTRFINLSGAPRAVYAHINLTYANGTQINNWRQGSFNMSPGETIVRCWYQYMPPKLSMVGDNMAVIHAADVTAPPYNQPPYPPSGDTDSETCVVTGLVP